VHKNVFLTVESNRTNRFELIFWCESIKSKLYLANQNVIIPT